MAVDTARRLGRRRPGRRPRSPTAPSARAPPPSARRTPTRPTPAATPTSPPSRCATTSSPAPRPGSRPASTASATPPSRRSATGFELAAAMLGARRRAPRRPPPRARRDALAASDRRAGPPRHHRQRAADVRRPVGRTRRHVRRPARRALAPRPTRSRDLAAAGVRARLRLRLPGHRRSARGPRSGPRPTTTTPAAVTAGPPSTPTPAAAGRPPARRRRHARAVGARADLAVWDVPGDLDEPGCPSSTPASRCPPAAAAPPAAPIHRQDADHEHRHVAPPASSTSTRPPSSRPAAWPARPGARSSTMAKKHTTVAVERATLRLAGLGGADDEGTPWVNRLIDTVRADADVGGLEHGVALPGLGRPAARRGRRPRRAGPEGRRRLGDASGCPRAGRRPRPRREPQGRSAPASRRSTRRRAERERMISATATPRASRGSTSSSPPATSTRTSRRPSRPPARAPTSSR